jgi:hypothetical protein
LNLRIKKTWAIFSSLLFFFFTSDTCPFFSFYIATWFFYIEIFERDYTKEFGAFILWLSYGFGIFLVFPPSVGE